MPRTHAPIFAAVLGVGLVLAATRAPEEVVARVGVEADLGAVVRDGEAARAQAGVAHVPAVDPVVPQVVRAEAVAAAIEDAALAIELPDVLSTFVVPRDRLALSAGTHTPNKTPFATDGASIVALVASWCAPCAKELPRLHQLATQTGARLVLVSLDDVAGPESLAAVIEDLYARAEPSSRLLSEQTAGRSELSELSPRAELRADPDGAWTDATAPLLVDRGDPGALPQTLVFADGELVMLVQGELDEGLAARAAVHLADVEVCR